MKINSKAQAAFEYLITYGWAILGVLIVGVVLWQFGAFNPPTPPPGCSSFSQIKPVDWKAGNDQFIVTLTNDAGLKLNISKIRVDITDAGCGSDPLIPPHIEIRPGESYKSTITCGQLSSEYSSGQYYRVHINVTYINPQSVITHLSKGECWGSIE